MRRGSSMAWFAVSIDKPRLEFLRDSLDPVGRTVAGTLPEPDNVLKDPRNGSGSTVSHPQSVDSRC
jgi:hypothetical protein